MTFSEALLRVFSVASLPLGIVGATGIFNVTIFVLPLVWLWLWIPALIVGLLGAAYLYWKDSL
jgi:hypothetical protein